MVQRPFVGAANVHAGLFAHGLESFEFAELGRIVGVRKWRFFEVVWDVRRVGHENLSNVFVWPKTKAKSLADEREWRGFF